MEVIHPFLFLQFFRDLLSPLNKYTTESGIDAIANTWLVMAILFIVAFVIKSGLKRIPGNFRTSWNLSSER